jgi:hypothetical protein
MADPQATNTEPQAQQTASGTQTAPAATQTAPAFDYEKLASIIQGKQTVTEDTVLKSYFKQQGLSQEEATQAINQFKTQKAQNTPDVAALQTQVAQAQAQARQYQIENAAQLAALELGIDVKGIPFLLKAADLSGAVGQDGTINADAVKEALNKVLEAFPGIKPAAANTQAGTGFVQVGASGGAGQSKQVDQQELLNNLFGIKKK